MCDRPFENKHSAKPAFVGGKKGVTSVGFAVCYRTPVSTPRPQNPFVWRVRKAERNAGILPGGTIRRNRGALAVWEWAMIVAIIAVFFTIALPAYKRATRAAKSAVCLSNVLYQYRMFSMYTQDYDETYPPLPATGDLRLALRPVQKNEDAWTVRLAPYREARAKEKNDPFVCPAADPDVMTYSYNAALGTTLFPAFVVKGMPATDAGVKAPARTYLLWDTANRSGANALVGYRYFSGARQGGAYRVGDLVLPSQAIKADWIKPRHNGVTVLFCDGHTVRLSDTTVRATESANPFDPASE